MVRLLIVLAVLAVFVAACEPDRSELEPDPTSTFSAPAEVEDFNAVVRDLGERAVASGFTASYTIQARASEQVIDGEVTWHRSGTRARADFEGVVNGADQQFYVIVGPAYPSDDLLYVCKPAQEMCEEARRETGGEYSLELLPALLPLRLLDTGVFATGLSFFDQTVRKIVGQDVRCFVGEVSGRTTSINHGEVCLTDGGAPLLVTASGSGTTVSLSATDPPERFDVRAFDLPFELSPPE